MALNPMAEVDAALARAKGPLRECRDKYAVTGDVTFRLRYASSGEVFTVTIDHGPPGMSPEFIVASTAVLKGMVAFPRTGDGGEMVFTDLGPGSQVSAVTVNAAEDKASKEHQAEKTRTRNRNFFIVAGAIGVLYVVGANVDTSGCSDGSSSSSSGPTATDRREWAAKFQAEAAKQGKTRVTFHAVGTDATSLEVGAWNCTEALLKEFVPTMKATILSYGFRRLECPGGRETADID